MNKLQRARQSLAELGHEYTIAEIKLYAKLYSEITSVVADLSNAETERLPTAFAAAGYTENNIAALMHIIEHCRENQMGKKKRKKPALKKDEGIFFALEGTILHYPGPMLEFHGQISATEWVAVVEETVKYAVFARCLKDVAFPLLDEGWTEKDESQLKQLELSSARMRNIDPLLVAKYNPAALKEAYSAKMRDGASSLNGMIAQFRTPIAPDTDKTGESDITHVSDL